MTIGILTTITPDRKTIELRILQGSVDGPDKILAWCSMDAAATDDLIQKLQSFRAMMVNPDDPGRLG